MLIIGPDRRIVCLGYPGKAALPAGKIRAENNETWSEAAVRIAKEQTGIQVLAQDFLYAGPDANGSTVVTFIATKWAGHPTPCPWGEACGWATWSDLGAGPTTGYEMLLQHVLYASSRRQTLVRPVGARF